MATAASMSNGISLGTVPAATLHPHACSPQHWARPLDRTLDMATTLERQQDGQTSPVSSIISSTPP